MPPWYRSNPSSEDAYCCRSETFDQRLTRPRRLSPRSGSSGRPLVTTSGYSKRRRARPHAAWSARWARYREWPPLRATSRDTVDGALPNEVGPFTAMLSRGGDFVAHDPEAALLSTTSQPTYLGATPDATTRRSSSRLRPIGLAPDHEGTAAVNASGLHKAAICLVSSSSTAAYKPS